MRTYRTVVPILALLASAAGAQQASPSDAGTLRIMADGRLLAEEEFQLRPEAGGVSLSVTSRRGETSTVTLAVVGARRLTVRLSGAEGEIARELPFSSSAVVFDDSVFAFLALLPAAVPGAVQVVRPRVGDRVDGTLTDRGMQSVTTDDGPVRLHGYELRIGDQTIRAWYDTAGRLARASLPGRRIEIVRVGPP